MKTDEFYKLLIDIKETQGETLSEIKYLSESIKNHGIRIAELEIREATNTGKTTVIGILCGFIFSVVGGIIIRYFTLK